MKRSDKFWIEAQERFEADEEPPLPPNYPIANVLFEIRMTLWLIFIVLCVITWRVW